METPECLWTDSGVWGWGIRNPEAPAAWGWVSHEAGRTEAGRTVKAKASHRGLCGVGRSPTWEGERDFHLAACSVLAQGTGRGRGWAVLEREGRHTGNLAISEVLPTRVLPAKMPALWSC